MPAFKHRLFTLPLLVGALLTGCSDDPNEAASPPVAQTPVEQEAASDRVSRNPSASVPLRVQDISVQTWQGRQAAAVTLSTPVAVDRPFDAWLMIETDTGELVKGAWVADTRGKVLYFTGLEPEQSYRVRVRPGLRAANGNVLANLSSVVIETPALQSALGFAGRGNLLAHRLRQGLPVMAVNVDQVDVDFYRIPQGQLVDFLSRFGNATQLSSWDAERYLDKVELAWSGRFDLELDDNTRATRYLPVQDVDALNTSGVYLAVMREAGDISYRYPATWFAVTDLGAQVRLYKDRLQVQVNTLSGADPLAGVKLTLLDEQGHLLADAATDRAGRAAFMADQLKPGALTAAPLLLLQKGPETSLLRLNGPGLDLAEFPVDGRQRTPQELFIYSPRDLYRPGETLIFSALLRSSKGEPVPGIPVEAALIQPDGRVVASQNLEPRELNYYETRLPLPKDAPTGEWRWQLSLPDGSQHEYAVQVETFLPERMSLALDAPGTLAPKTDWQVAVQGDYLYGAPAADNRLQTQLLARLEAHPYEKFKDFWFGSPRDTALERREDLAEIRLDDNGRGVIEVESYWQELTSPLRLQAFASLLDAGGRPVSRRASSIVLPADRLAGIRPLFTDDQVDYESSAGFELVLTDGEKRLSAEGMQVSLVRERRDYHWSWSDAEGWQSHFTERHYTVEQRELDVSADTRTEIEFPVEWGHYRVEIKDPSTGLVSAYAFQAGWDPDSQLMAGRPDRIGLSLNQQTYAAGDILKVQVRPPAAGKGYLLLESDRPLHREPIEIPAEGKTLSLTLKPEWLQQNLFLSVLLLKAGDAETGELPMRMLGIEPVPLSSDDQALEISFGELPAQVRPEQTIEVPIQVERGNGQALPDRVRVTLAAVDVGVLSITDFQTPDPLNWFFEPGAYPVEVRDNYGDLIDAEDGEMARLRYGGDADLSRGGAQPPTDVQILSLFSGALTVGADGSASIPLELPAFNGKMRLMAVAFSDDSFGAADQELTVVAPVVAELNRPRFLAPGDETRLTLELHNRTEQAQTLQVTLEAEAGMRLDGHAGLWQPRVELAAGARTKLSVHARAGSQYGAVPLTLKVSGIKGEADINRRWTLGVRPAWPAQSLNWQQPLAPGDVFRLQGQALQGLVPSTLNAQLSLASRPPFNLARHFSELRAYPYGCAEQTTSGVFAQLYVSADVLTALGLADEDAAARKGSVELAIRRLFGMQRHNGSFGLWSKDSPEEPWLTVYITDFLLRAREAGYAVSEPGLKQALEQVGRYLRNPSRINGELLHDGRSRVAVRAYAAQVLARAGQAPLAEMRTLLDHQAGEATPLALVQLGLALQQAGDGPRAERALQRGLLGLNKSDFTITDYGSSLRDRALALFWLLENDQPETTWLPLLEHLQADMSRRTWFSTQERNALFLAGQALSGRSGNALELALSGALEEQLQGQQHRLQLTGQSLLEGLNIRNEGEDQAWVNLRLQGYTDQPPASFSQGLTVERHYYDADGKPLDISTLTTGQQAVVELRVSSDEPLRDALVVDLLPAGLELENQNLAHSLELGELQIGEHRLVDLMALSDIRHQEFRDDRYVAALNLERRRARIFYLARAVTPGRYRVPPTFAESMYRPDIRHLGDDSGMLTIKAQ
ncbi:alpha-2-macroglobulin family protein [Marinobacterium weihaiense]|uniref:Alpha-2-macroglobulin n=1 Tax=Marinobacterium weihaiense TaxID=2851016 RepID=A0ABS6MEF5_9GAMM|nr:alpha-2-macroglobulin [Marinobacterium weihaiense]MBV0934668.1 alpha-2-macroglobulin family protein [Marinobacterium weihaiense]